MWLMENIVAKQMLINDNGHDEPGSASDSFIVEGKDASSRNNHDVGQVENENIDSGKNVYRAHNEPVESQKEKEELTHWPEMIITIQNGIIKAVFNSTND